MKKAVKKVVAMSGHIPFPLKEGSSTYITCSQGILQTSTVVNIITDTENFAHFETMNSEYKVTLEKSPVTLAQTPAKCA